MTIKGTILLLLISVGGLIEVNGQVNLLRYDSILVKKNTSGYFRNPWAGGLNSAQFSPIDLNGDGIKDLFVYERDVADKNGIALTFLNMGTEDSIDYSYAPEYQADFPPIQNWVLLVDYNCDDKADLFTWMPGGIKVYRNDYDTINGLSFTLVSTTGNLWSPALTTVGFTGPVNLYVSQFDLPAIVDVDDDGDMDILCFCLGCETVEWNRNYSMENYGVCDSLDFVVESKCWGEFSEDPVDNAITLGITCKAGKTGVQAAVNHPGGSSMLALDMDGDQDKELVLGNIASDELVLLINGGDMSNASMVSVAANFPSNSTKVNIATFPAAYYLDVDNDGLKDLVATPNTTGSIRNFNSTWFYKNEGLVNAPIFNLQKNDFLQGEMIEVGEGGNPVFFDHNSDGLMDLIVGNYGYWGTGGTYTGKLSLYENTGTPGIPEYELITRDYQGIASFNLNGLYPAFGDLDGDGDEDMIIGDYVGLVHLFENTAGAGNTAVFAISGPNYKGIDVGNFAAPQLVDANRDGLLDLLIGEQAGRIEYYENIGTASVPNFVSIPTNGYFGEIDVMPDCCTGYSVPFLTPIDTSGDYYLFVANENGGIQLYGEIEGNLAGNFGLADSMVGNVDLGLRTSISAADINGDGALELVIGNFRGGIEIFTLEGSAVIGLPDRESRNLPVTIFPNPTTGVVTMESKLGSVYISAYCIKDILGRELASGIVLNSDPVSFDLSAFGEGLYLVDLRFSNGYQQIEKIILR